MHRPKTRSVLLAALSFYVAAVTISIEIQNARGGYPFPNREYRDNDELQGPVTMRRCANPRTDQEQARNRVIDIVESFGMLQYLAAPLLIALSIFSLKTRCVSIYLRFLGMAVGVTACGFMLYRGYFTSLG
ncbi:MAG TPA: hypothetical protein VKX17_20095 [Planctomycetota bacterium]|nr:hypothetical protein [Planctomycetota bacterium]